MRYTIGQSGADLLYETAGRQIVDLYPTADGRAIAFQTRTTANQLQSFELYNFDPIARKPNIITKFEATPFAYLLGWTRDNAGLVVARAAQGTPSAASDADITVLSPDGGEQFSKTIRGGGGQEYFRLVGGQDVYYLARDADGTANLWVYSLITQRSRIVSRNSRLDVGFGSVETLGPRHVVAVVHERTRNIYLLKAKLTN